MDDSLKGGLDKHMRNVVERNEVAHLWAHQSQPGARNGTGSLFFTDKTIYSYGEHFPIATFVDNARGETGILFTTRGYSVTSSHHISMVRGSIRGLSYPVFDVSLNRHGHRGYVSDTDIADYITEYQRRVENASKEVAKSKKDHIREYRYKTLVDLVDNANRFAAFFDRPERFEVPEDFDALKTELSRIAADERKAKRIEQARIAKDNAERIDRWKAGDSVTLPWSLDKTFIRIEGEGEGAEVVTSKGARVPIAHAIAGLAVVRRVRDSGKAYERNGHTIHLGVYAVDKIDAEGNLTAGCHHISIEEIERLAPELEARLALASK